MTHTQTTLTSAIEAIGQTPLVDLARITEKVDGTILAKLEYLNPGFSKKDRFARQVIEEAETEGLLTPGRTVVELTSGNTGTGLAIVCGVKGYRFVAVMSRGNSMERARMMSALGAEVILVDQLPDSTPGQVSGGDLALVEDEARRIVKERDAFRADQFALEANFRAHFLHTGPEIIAQADRRITGFCDFAGTGGTFSGIAAALKEHDPEILCYLVEPAGAAVLAGQKISDPNHRIQGGGYSMPDLPQIRPENVDGYLAVTDQEAMTCARRLAVEEGIFGGFSSGANLAAALKILEGSCRGGCVVMTINDSGLKYLSTDLWPGMD